MGDLIFRRDRDSISRDKIKMQVCTHTDGPQKDDGINHRRKKKWKGRRRNSRNVFLPFLSVPKSRDRVTHTTFH